MLALSIVEGSARGLVAGHPTKDVHPELVEGFFSGSTPPLLGRKPSSVKSRISISSKLIEIKGLQVLYFGHLRKTGGRGSYRLIHTARCPWFRLVQSNAGPQFCNLASRAQVETLLPQTQEAGPCIVLVVLVFAMVVRRPGPDGVRRFLDQPG